MNNRYFLILASSCVLMLILIFFLLKIQLTEREFLAGEGAARSIRTEAIPARRGRIYDRNNKPLAISTQVFSIAINPQVLSIPAKTQHRISNLLELDYAQIVKKSKRTDSKFVYLKHAVTPIVAAQLREMQIKGLYLESSFKRYYPAANITSHLVGFTDAKHQGQEGIELQYNDLLHSISGSKKVIKDLDGNIIKEIGIINHPQDGKDIQLSIDLYMQYIAHKALANSINKHGAQSGSIVILQPQTGQILAMVNQPDYNPNNRSSVNFDDLRNRAVTDTFEPGSTIKPFTAALALAHNIEGKINTSPGYMKIDGHTIRDLSNYGKLDIAQIIYKSSNVGSAKLALQIEEYSLVNLLDDLGFGQYTSSNIIGEKQGKLPLGKRLSAIDRAVLSYGYGLSSTALQVAKAYAVIANNGKLLPVSILAKSEQFIPEQIIAPEHAIAVKDMLYQAVSKKGTGSSAQVKGIRVGGKTGTVHKVRAKAGYSDSEYIALFAGIAPIDKPELVVVVVIDSPKGNTYYGGEVAAPVFSEVVSQVLR